MERPQPAIPAPGFLRKWQVWSVLMVLFLVPFFVHIPRSLNHHPVISPLGDQVHIVLFGGITLLLYWFGPLQGRIWWAAAASGVMGGAVELLQLLVNRQALFQDFLLDLVGIGLVVSYVHWRGYGRQATKWVFLLLLFSIPVQFYNLPWQISAVYRARDMFPVLANFETYGDRFLWSSTSKGQLSFLPIPDSPSGDSSVLQLATDAGTHWPGASLRRFPEDWSDFSVMKLDIRLTEAPGDSLKFGVRLDDYEGITEQVWVANSFHATREWQTYSMPIADRKIKHSKRNLNLKEMDRLYIYFPKPKVPVAIQIDNIRLE